MNMFTSPESCSACCERLEAAVSTMPAALPVSLAAALTAPMFLVTSWVASEVWLTLRAISAVAAPCSSMAAPIVVDGVDVIPARASVAGHVVEAHPSGRVKGRATIGLQFERLSIGDQQYTMSAAPVDRAAQDTHKKDALSIGVPAAAGSLIGAIAGGKKGALIGGAVAGGAGTAYVLSTPGKDVVLPAGTRIRVKLLDPLIVRAPITQ